MSIPGDTNISEMRATLADFVQEHMAHEDNVAIGAILIYELIGTDGDRTLMKITANGTGADPCPIWTQDGMLQHAMNHEDWGEWHTVGLDDEEDDN